MVYIDEVARDTGYILLNHDNEQSVCIASIKILVKSNSRRKLLCQGYHRFDYAVFMR